MHCSSTRELLHQWFDLSGSGSIPSEAAAHLRDCSDCRDFVRRWDQIELGLQGLRDQALSPSPDFRISLEAPRKRYVSQWIQRNPFIYARWAAAAATVIIMLLGITYALTGRWPLPPERAGSLAIVQPAPNSNYSPNADQLNRDLPLANTR